MVERIGPSRLAGMALLGAACASILVSPAVAQEQEADRLTDRVVGSVVGRVVGLQGRVQAQTPGRAPRLLVANAPIYAGDRLMTSVDAQLGVLSDECHVGLNADTALIYARAADGSPHVTLERGDVRIINAGEGAAPRIETLGIVVAASGIDTAAYAFPDRSGRVSMVCAFEGQIVASHQGGGGGLRVAEGGCVAYSAERGLHATGETKRALPLLAGSGGARRGQVAGGSIQPVVGPAAPRFGDPADVAGARFGDPADVALGGGLAALGFAVRPELPSNNPINVAQSCDLPGSGCGLFAAPAGLEPPGTEFPNRPPRPAAE